MNGKSEGSRYVPHHACLSSSLMQPKTKSAWGQNVEREINQTFPFFKKRIWRTKGQVYNVELFLCVFV